MAVPALVDDFAPESEAAAQLTLGGEAFDIVRSLAEAGAITSTALTLSPDMTYEQFESLGVWVGLFNRSCSWWIGDLLVFGEGVFPDRYAQAASLTGLAEQTLLNRVYVAKNVPPSRRRAGLSFGVHAEVAPLGAREQKQWLDRAEKAGWTRADLRNAMKAKRKDEKPQLLPEDDIDLGALTEAVRSLLANCEEAGENVICRREDVARVKAAIGEEE